MNLAPLIHPYTQNHQQACLVSFKSNVPQFFTEPEIQEFENFLKNYPTQINAKPEDRKTYFYVVEVNHQVVGCGGFGDKNRNQIISLAWGHIHLDFHKQGLGELLLKFRLEEIKKIFPSVPLVIETTQFSSGFYEKNGFVTQGITADYYTVGMDKYEMTWLPSTSGIL
jgi:ribosomal-protein-alanine N-acetyltransferase